MKNNSIQRELSKEIPLLKENEVKLKSIKVGCFLFKLWALYKTGENNNFFFLSHKDENITFVYLSGCYQQQVF